MFDSSLFDPINQYAHQGGEVIWLLLGVCVLLWVLVIERLIYLHKDVAAEHKRVQKQWHERKDKHSWYAEKIREEMLSKSHARLNRGLSAISLLIAICPLLGLLGTVTGMVNVFDTIAQTGTSDAKAMADGIYRATVPTMTGLVLALSGLYFAYHLKRQAERKYRALEDSIWMEGKPDNDQSKSDEERLD